MYTVKQWIHMLSELPQDAVVIVSSDSEGNSFSPMSNGIGEGLWHDDHEEWVNEEDAAEYLPEELQKAVFLFPNR